MIKGAGNFIFSLRCPLNALRTASSAGTAIFSLFSCDVVLFSVLLVEVAVVLFASVCN